MIFMSVDKNPLSPDTDHDGINDGDELNYWNVTRGLDMDTAISYCKIPDVDGDNITDGKEIKGYSVKIIVGWKSDGTPISRMRYISPDEMDPLIPYANSTGVWTDTDRDGIPDVAETYLSNRSQWSYFAKHYSALWNDYSWVSSYFWTVYWKDYDEHHNSTAAMQNATQWLSNQFNPMIVDHTPPVITKFDLSWDVEGSWVPPSVSVYAVVHLAIHDVGGITSFTITDWDNGERYTPDNLGETSYEVWQWFDVSAFTAAFGSVKIGVYAQDSAGNSIYVEKELKGALQSVIDALAKLWDAIWSALQKVAQAIMSALSAVFQWIIDHIMDLLDRAISPVLNAINSFANEILGMITEYINPSRNPDPITVKDIFNAITSGGFFYSVLALCLAVQTISTFLTIYSMGLGALLGKAVSMVTVELAKELVKSIAVTMVSVAGLTSIVAVLYFFKPKDDPFWKEGLGLAVYSLTIALGKFITAFKIGDTSGIKTEAIGLVLAIAGAVIAFKSTTLVYALISLVLSGIGAFITWFNKDIFDRMIVAPLKDIEEIISAIALAYSIATIGKFT